MDTRREFLKKAAMLAGATGLVGVLPASIQRAMAIDPKTGTTWLDAEHVVILMQENRSFDHCYGALRGVRGFRDPRAITLPNGNPVWLQTNEAGETYGPFRLDIKGTTNQTDARNDGRYDQWLPAKHSGQKEYAHMPLTMGHYDRRDIPFYYALADAFTVCDQNFCSALTGTTPNRLHLFTGTIRGGQDGNVRARVRNEDTDYGVWASWTTFPERLEDHGVDWAIYQNEISLESGLEGEWDEWLTNFSDNPIEWFTQHNVGFSPTFMQYMPVKIEALGREIDELQKKIAGASASPDLQKWQTELVEKQMHLKMLEQAKVRYTPENFEKLSQREKNLFTKAFRTNTNDPSYRELTTLEYQDGDKQRQLKVPKGDVLHQFREDVKGSKLPTVSWLVPPENFSDHPGAPWYGAWYVSEVLDILTQNPEVWKKTVFVLCYDENDGYFDHVPPFVSPVPDRPDTGLASKGIDLMAEYVTLEQDLQRASKEEARSGPIGLGFRVPLVIASPWSRGGYVNSQVFDHTSILQMLEKFITHRTGRKLEDTNINAWRRAVCGDLSSVFRPYTGGKVALPTFLEKDQVIEGIHKAKFKELPEGYKRTSAEEILEIQEKGIRPSCALPYEFDIDGELTADKMDFQVSMHVGNVFFRERSAGSPFTIYSHGRELKTRNYAVVAGDQLIDKIPLDEFENGHYDLRLYGPNGFFRSFAGDKNDPPLLINLFYENSAAQMPTGRIELKMINTDYNRTYTIHLKDNAYKNPDQQRILEEIKKGPDRLASIFVDPAGSHGWYDFSVFIEGFPLFEKRYAGRVETGRDGFSDPAMA
jgi:phospholipase C